MNVVQNLVQLNIGEKGEIKGLFISGAMRRRLQDIGLIEGTKIECVLKSPGGDPVAYQIRGAVIALRREESENILVSML